MMTDTIESPPVQDEPVVASVQTWHRDLLPVSLRTANGFKGDEYQVELCDNFVLTQDMISWRYGNRHTWLLMEIETGTVVTQFVTMAVSKYAKRDEQSGGLRVYVRMGFAVIHHLVNEGGEKLTIYLNPVSSAARNSYFEHGLKTPNVVSRARR